MEMVITQQKKLLTTKNMVMIAMLGAFSAVLMFFQFPIPFVPPFYELDFCEVPVLIGSFAMGPLAGVVIAAIKILVFLAIHGTKTAGVGELSNFIQACSLILPASLIYQHKKNKRSAVMGMTVGVILMCVVGCFTNIYIMIPTYARAFNMPLDAIIAMGNQVNGHITNLNSLIILAVAPFNLLKGGLVSLITALIYKRVSVVIKHKDRAL